MPKMCGHPLWMAPDLMKLPARLKNQRVFVRSIKGALSSLR